ncbi:MAG: helix-turn-helix domain-containing protein [Saccharofermentanales bacterium]|jgi:putative transcriptional regulator
MISYKPFEHLLIDRDLLKKDVSELSGVHSQTLAKMSRGESVNLETIDRICTALKCRIDEVVEILPNKE